jgi:hypothetical protein
MRLSKFEVAFYTVTAIVWCMCFSTLIEPDLRHLLQLLTA